MDPELKYYLNIVRRKLWLIIMLVLLITIGTAAFNVFFVKPTYSASNKLVVNSGSNQESLRNIDLSTITTNIKLVSTYKELIKSTAIMDKVIEKHPEWNLTTNQLIAKTEVRSGNESQIMSLSVTDQSHERAAIIVNAIADVFKSEAFNIMRVDNITILNAAKSIDSPSPIKPNIQLNILLAFIVSLLISFGVVFLLEYMDDTIKSEKEIVNYTGLPVLASISKIKKSDIRHKKRLASGLHTKAGETKYAGFNQ